MIKFLNWKKIGWNLLAIAIIDLILSIYQIFSPIFYSTQSDPALYWNLQGQLIPSVFMSFLLPVAVIYFLLWLALHKNFLWAIGFYIVVGLVYSLSNLVKGNTEDMGSMALVVLFVPIIVGLFILRLIVGWIKNWRARHLLNQA